MGGTVLKVFEPSNLQEAVEGWALHTTRRRRIHEDEARWLDKLRYTAGVLSAGLSAAAGTSAFAAWQTSGKSVFAAVLTAVVGVGAAVLANVLAFLNLGARAESHRHAAAAYKRILHEFEEASGLRGSGELKPEQVNALKELLTAADDAAPPIPARRGARVEGQPFEFIQRAEQLAPGAVGGSPRSAVRPPTGNAD